MRYVANNISIPVPKAQRVWCQDEVTYFTMDIVGGEQLEYAWHNMSDRTKRRVVERLPRPARALKPPIEGAVMSVTGGLIRDGRRVVHQFLRGGGTGYQLRCSKK